MVTPSDILTIALLVALEGLLSADNAMVLAVLVLGLPKTQQKKALRYGILGAFFFRTIATLLAFYLIKVGWVKILGAGYLMYLTYRHFGSGQSTEARRAHKPAEPAFGLSAFWATVVKVELTDIVFAIDSILVAVAMSPKTWVVVTGGILGIIAMRLVIGKLLALVERYPPLVDGAFIIIGWVAVKLFVEYLNTAGYIHFEIPKVLSLGLIVVIFVVSYFYAVRQEGGAILKNPWTFRMPRRRIEWAALALLVVVVTAGSISLVWMSRYAFAVRRLTRGVGDTVFYDADGKPWFRLDEQRHDVPLAAIARICSTPSSPSKIGASFFILESIRSARHERRFEISRRGGRAEGGSTLTQQLARTLFLSNARTWGRKAKEASIAVLMEVELTKDQILELYLNRIYLSAGVYGVETMSEHLFRKPARAVTLSEAALIAGLIRSPATLSPWSNYDGAIERSHTVLALMRDQGFISPAQEQTARNERPRIQPYRQPQDLKHAWAKDYLRQQFRNEFGGDNPPDWRVRTTFRPSIQDAAERAVAVGLDRLRRPGLEAALVAIDPSTGDILALVGGGNYARNSFNRAVRSKRQPGSAFKPFVYAAALAKGYSPVSVLNDLQRVPAPSDPEWMPRSHGEQPNEMTLRAALLESNNAAAADLQQEIGSKAVLAVASDAGLHDLPDVPSLALGTGVVSPLELTAAYSMFPGMGEMVRARGMLAVLDSDGDSVFATDVQRQRVVSPQVAYQMTTMLRDVIERGTGSAARAGGVRGPIGGKTGTTDAYRDAWFVGFSTAVVAGVWVGLDQPAPIGSDAYAARIAVPIWAEFMRRTAQLLPPREFTLPDGLTTEELCSVSYVKPVDGCPTYTEYFKNGDKIPSQRCPIHQGSLKQRTARAIQGIFRSLGSKIAGIFKR